MFVGDRIFLLTDLRDGAYEQFKVELPQPRASSENRLNPEFIRLRESHLPQDAAAVGALTAAGLT